MQVSTALLREGLGVGRSSFAVPSLFLRCSVALPSLFLRSNRNEKAKAQWSYGEGITKRLPTKKIFFQNYGTSSQNRSILLTIRHLIA